MSQLFSPRAVGPLTLKNRVVIAPMCQYSAIDGVPQPWHVQHLGRLAISGAGLVVVEASEGQLEDELRLALSHADLHAPPISHVRRQGGALPSQAEVVEHVLGLEGVQ